MTLWSLTSNFLFLGFFGNVKNVLKTFETRLKFNNMNNSDSDVSEDQKRNIKITWDRREKNKL